MSKIQSVVSTLAGLATVAGVSFTIWNAANTPKAQEVSSPPSTPAQVDITEQPEPPNGGNLAEEPKEVTEMVFPPLAAPPPPVEDLPPPSPTP